jgi:hypothetical protein
MKSLTSILGAICIFSSLYSFNTNATLPADGHYDIWPTVPFLRGADLCKYKDAYGETRTEYMQKMVTLAKDLLKEAKVNGQDALQMLTAFNSMYDKNQEMAMKSGSMDATLESNLKSSLDQIYRELVPRTKKISFTNVNDVLEVVKIASQGARDGHLTKAMLSKLDFVAYGTYSLAPNCRGDIQVNIHLIGKSGQLESFSATGTPDSVMLNIAKQIFVQFQKTEIPTQVKIGKNLLTIVGGLNGAVDMSNSPELAQSFCESLDARLPTKLEMEVIDGYGDWSGGISFNNKTFVLPDNQIYVSLFKSYPVRHMDEVNDREFSYYCVK